ncbi:MAG: hypothetical protein WC878_05795 [Candidatus Paceibacterota bacterium]|jgi:hypothetical protein
MSIWVVFIVLGIWWFSKQYRHHTAGAPKSAEFSPEKKEVSEDHALEIQTKFENQLRDVCLPSAIGGKEIYIYKNLMSVWYAQLSAENRYNDAMTQKLRTDWLEYMNALRDKSTHYYLSLELAEKGKENLYQNDHFNAAKKVFEIEEAFASAVGKDAVDTLARTREMKESSSFSREGELIPDGFEINAEGKLQPKKKTGIKNFFRKRFS